MIQDMLEECEYCDELASPEWATFNWVVDPMCPRHLLEELAEIFSVDDEDISDRVNSYVNRLELLKTIVEMKPCSMYGCGTFGRPVVVERTSTGRDGYFPVYAIGYYCPEHSASVIMGQWLDSRSEWMNTLRINFDSIALGVALRDENVL